LVRRPGRPHVDPSHTASCHRPVAGEVLASGPLQDTLGAGYKRVLPSPGMAPRWATQCHGTEGDRIVIMCSGSRKFFVTISHKQAKIGTVIPNCSMRRRGAWI